MRTLHLDAVTSVLDRWSQTASVAERTAVYDLLFALVDGRSTQYALAAIDT